MRWLAWLLVASVAVFVAACSTAPAAQAPVAPSVGSAEATAPAEAGPSERECDELITRAVALGIDERAAHGAAAGAPAAKPGTTAPQAAQAGPAVPATTSADHEAVRRSLRDDFLAGCRALSRAEYRCAIAAASLAALAACQPSPSSSTSNSSVAPGGMAPPAPRSP